MRKNTSHYLNIRATWEPSSWLTAVHLAISYDLNLVGTGARRQSLTADFDFEWTAQAIDHACLESFELRPEKVAALGNRYEVYSTSTGELLATIHDHKWNLIGLRCLTCESVIGHLTVDETARSSLLGLVNLGLSRKFDVKGSVSGEVSLERSPGMSNYDVLLDRDPGNVAQANAVLVGLIIVLTRSIGERD
jgi:hypothetical protein